MRVDAGIAGASDYPKSGARFSGGHARRVCPVGTAASRAAPSEAREVLVRVHAAGVGPWDALVREGTGGVAAKPPLVLGSDISGIVERVGSNVTHVMPGDEVFGVTNDTFTGAYAEHAVAKGECIDRKPTRLSHVEAASVPVIGTTAWVMLFEHARWPQDGGCSSSARPAMSGHTPCSWRRAPGRRCSAWATLTRSPPSARSAPRTRSTRTSPCPPPTSSSTQSGGRCWRDRSTR